MKTVMKKSELARIISRHQHWVKEDCKGWEHMRADLCGVDLSGFDLHGVNLSGANLTGTILTGANLSGANLSGASLPDANLSNANLSGANLSHANLHEAKLSGANLTGADLFNADLSRTDLSHANISGANLYGVNLSHANMSEADLRGANLTGADMFSVDLTKADLRGTNLSGADLTHVKIYTAIFDKKDEIRKGVVLTKPMKGYKKTAEGVVITAEIPAGAVVYSINGKKCRTNMAKILDTAGHKLLHSSYDRGFTYKRGQKIIIPDFDVRYNVECGTGFHFFRTKKEANNY